MPHAPEASTIKVMAQWSNYAPRADVRAIANWSNEQRHSRVCTGRDGPHRLDPACIGSQLPKLPDKESSYRGRAEGEHFVQRRRALGLLD
jgi:hypothetical protein